ncbi:MAG: ferrous iron transport protein B [Candidatus Latescibacteria bacterium]|nr:ferrous iron transport protein B [Candidatus Latescibacterota bacterium]
MAVKPTVIGLAGNPNCGKTSLFNYITGSRQHVGNYPGVTVEKKEGTVLVDDMQVTVIDLPGTYSLSPYSLDEKIARQEILSEQISAIIVVVDSTHLERNLYLFSQIIETGKPVVLALNMFDELDASGNILNVEQLSVILGVPCVKTVGNRGKGVPELISTALKVSRNEIEAIGNHPVYSHEMEHAIDAVIALIHGTVPYNERWCAVNLLQFGRSFSPYQANHSIAPDVHKEIDKIRDRLESLEGRKIQNIITAGRYGYATGAVTECMKAKVHTHRTITEKIDSVLTHRWLGFPLFLSALWIMFQTTFTLGAIPMEWIEAFFEKLVFIVTKILPGGLFQSLIVDGIIAGVGGVLVFLPNILILFFFITFFEDTGYMARSAFIMDRIMHSFGLHGKSFLPMLVGFGCTVPAVMATRTIENRRDRLITMFIVPFMSCGARLPVYILLAGAFFSPKNAGNIIFSLYLVGITISFLVAWILSFVKDSSASFVMELPPYRIPTLRSILLHIWERAFMYIRKAGTIILSFSIIIWVLMTFPQAPQKAETDTLPINSIPPISHTYAAQFGKFIEPALKPLGFDWRMGVALIAGFAAKEVIVSTLATIYKVGDVDDQTIESNLKNALRNDPLLNPVKAYALMLFILIYVPCIAVLGVIKREAGGWKWIVLMVVYTTTLAWLVSFSFIKIASFIS